jgi:hypothetical protein
MHHHDNEKNKDAHNLPPASVHNNNKVNNTLQKSPEITTFQPSWISQFGALFRKNCIVLIKRPVLLLCTLLLPALTVWIVSVIYTAAKSGPNNSKSLEEKQDPFFKDAPIKMQLPTCSGDEEFDCATTLLFYPNDGIYGGE